MKRSVKRRKSIKKRSRRSRNDHGWSDIKNKLSSVGSKVSNTAGSVASKVSKTAGSVASKVANSAGSVANTAVDAFTFSSLFSDGKYRRRKSSKSRKRKSRKINRKRY